MKIFLLPLVVIVYIVAIGTFVWGGLHAYDALTPWNEREFAHGLLWLVLAGFWLSK